MCPLCQRVFRNAEDLSVAHLIPSALRGRKATVTCRECNSRIGTTIESHEVRRARFMDTLSGENGAESDVDVTFPENGSKRVRATWTSDGTRSDPHWTLSPVQEATAPNEMEESTRYLQDVKSRNSPFPLDISGKRGWSLRQAYRTYLHAAFLCLFHEFGYEWSLSRSAEAVRLKLLNADEDLDGYLLELTATSAPEAALRAAIVTDPEKMQGFLITMPMLRHLDKPLGVWLPLFDSDGLPPVHPVNPMIIRVASASFHSRLTTPTSLDQGHRFVRQCLDTARHQ